MCVVSVISVCVVSVISVGGVGELTCMNWSGSEAHNTT